MEASKYIPHYSIEDYLTWEGDWELWAGIPVAMSPSANDPHQGIAAEITYSLMSQMRARPGGCHCKLRYEIDWHVSDDTVVRPDVMVICEPYDTQWVTVTPALIVEILSPSTASKDKLQKRRLYAAKGVKYYALADPRTRTMETLQLTGEVYEPCDPTQLTLHDGCTLALDADDVFRGLD